MVSFKLNNGICKLYKLTNIINNKIYIGQTWLPLHIRMGKTGEGYKNSTYLYNAIKKWKCENFKYEILACCEIQKQADNLETFFISYFKSNDPDIGYNIKPIGGSVGKHSEETKAKISETMRNKEWSEEALINRRNAGRKGKGKKKKPHSEEWKENVAEKMKIWHAENNHPMTGKHHSEESKKKISKTSTGRKYPNRKRTPRMAKEKELGIIEKYKEGMSINQICRLLTTGVNSIYRVLERNNIPIITNRNNNWTGKVHSEETKQKMSKSRKRYWHNKRTLDK